MFPSRQEQSEQEQNQRRQLLRKKMNAQARGKQTTYAAASDLECEQDPVEDGSVFSSSSFFALSKQIQQQVASLPLSMKQYLSSRGQGRGQGSFSFARVPVTSLAGDDNYNSQFSESEHERENEEERGSAGSLGKWMTTPFSSLTQTQTQTQESEKEGGLMASLRASVSCVDVRISSLSWTQKMAGFLVCAVLGLLCSFLSISNVALIVISPARFALPYTFGNILSLLGTSFLVGPSYQLNTMFSESRRIASSLYFSALFLTLYSAFVLQSTLPTLLCVLLQSLSFAWYCLSYIPGGRTIGRTMAHSVSGCLARRCFSFTNTAGSGI